MRDLTMFDAKSHTQGNMPHLLQYLWDNYLAYLAKTNGDKKIDETKIKAIDFMMWAITQLQTTRAIESFFIDGNVGIKLTNNTTLAISPGVDIRGSMQESGYVPVTDNDDDTDHSNKSIII